MVGDLKNMENEMFNFALFVTLFACSNTEDQNDDLDNTGYMPYCEEVESPLELEEESPLGISGQDFMNSLALNYTTEVEFTAGSQSCLSGSLSPDTSTFRYVESTPVYPEAPEGEAVPAIAVDCPNYIAFEGTYTIVSEGGELDEELLTTFTISEYDLVSTEEPLSAKFFAEVESFNGSIEAVSEDEINKLIIQGEVGATFSGQVIMQTTSSDGDIVLAYNETLAEWTYGEITECDGFE